MKLAGWIPMVILWIAILILGGLMVTEAPCSTRTVEGYGMDRHYQDGPALFCPYGDAEHEDQKTFLIGMGLILIMGTGLITWAFRAPSTGNSNPAPPAVSGSAGAPPDASPVFATEVSQTASPQAAETPTPDGTLAQLQELVALRDSGGITEEEFVAAKALVLKIDAS